MLKYAKEMIIPNLDGISIFYSEIVKIVVILCFI